MKEIQELIKELQTVAERCDKESDFYTDYQCAEDVREIAGRLEKAVTPCNQLIESVKQFVCEVKGCCSVRINCVKCGSGEEVYFVPKGLISILKSVIDEAKGKDNGNDL